ncbi:pyridoxamine 5'-phosphate oxidase family protein [Paracoccus sp. (in: a-proteobacteria)]|uniref:pyridoxamine 5'-phosphate oxidase family protein n=1 Tax=Paracoccus sp. TaxID=267 RepID=UPI00289E175D|nr:pyridoxamine 5'-phosphate oxidase family protein [Paracoccus sp. (in: a-proteobacteria)]
MKWLTSEDLTEIYGTPGPASLDKVTDHVTPDYGKMLAASRFCVLATFGPRSVDASPRGDDGPVARLLDPKHIALPDWRGNDRIDSIRNIVADGRASLMFLIRGSGSVLRVRGLARVTDDATLCASFEREGKLPRCVIVLQVAEVYFQCARAVMRAGLWSGAQDQHGLPSPGQILDAIGRDDFDGAAYDAAWPARAAKTMW